MLILQGRGFWLLGQVVEERWGWGEPGMCEDRKQKMKPLLSLQKQGAISYGEGMEWPTDWAFMGLWMVALIHFFFKSVHWASALARYSSSIAGDTSANTCHCGVYILARRDTQCTQWITNYIRSQRMISVTEKKKIRTGVQECEVRCMVRTWCGLDWVARVVRSPWEGGIWASIWDRRQ